MLISANVYVHEEVAIKEIVYIIEYICFLLLSLV